MMGSRVRVTQAAPMVSKVTIGMGTLESFFVGLRSHGANGFFHHRLGARMGCTCTASAYLSLDRAPLYWDSDLSRRAHRVFDVVLLVGELSILTELLRS